MSDQLFDLIESMHEESHKKTIEMLEGGASAKHATREGWTLLHAAVYQDDEPLVRALVKAGADPHAKLKKKFYPEDEGMPKGTTPIDIAEDYEAENLLRWLRGDVEADGGLVGTWVLSTICYESSPDDDPDHVAQDRPANPEELIIALDDGGGCTFKRFGEETKGHWSEESGEVNLRIETETHTLKRDDHKLLFTDFDEEHGSKYVMSLKKR